MIYDIEKIYEAKDFESLSSTQLMELFKNVKWMVEILHDVKKIKKVTADLALMRQIIKGFNQIHNRREQLP